MQNIFPGPDGFASGTQDFMRELERKAAQEKKMYAQLRKQGIIPDDFQSENEKLMEMLKKQKREL